MIQYFFGLGLGERLQLELATDIANENVGTHEMNSEKTTQKIWKTKRRRST